MSLWDDSGYGARPVGFGDRPAVLTVDFQNAITRPESPMGRSELVHRALENTVRLLEVARPAGIPVISCVTAYHRDGGDRPRWKIDTVYEWELGSWYAELDERIADERDIVVVKKAPSIFFGTPVPAILAGQGIDTVIVTGCNTSGCIRASVVESFSYGWRTVVPRQCVGDQGIEPHEQNLLDVDRRYADVVDLDDVLAEIAKLAGAPSTGPA